MNRMADDLAAAIGMMRSNRHDDRENARAMIDAIRSGQWNHKLSKEFARIYRPERSKDSVHSIQLIAKKVMDLC